MCKLPPFLLRIFCAVIVCIISRQFAFPAHLHVDFDERKLRQNFADKSCDFKTNVVYECCSGGALACVRHKRVQQIMFQNSNIEIQLLTTVQWFICDVIKTNRSQTNFI